MSVLIDNTKQGEIMVRTMSLVRLIEQYDAEHALVRQLMIPEEDRPQFTSAKWSRARRGLT
jgi:hypothetical protein